MILDIHGKNDLDLNSARNEIVYNEKWHSFEQKLAFIICKRLSQNLGAGYVAELFDLFRNKTQNENFLLGMNNAITAIE